MKESPASASVFEGGDCTLKSNPFFAPVSLHFVSLFFHFYTLLFIYFFNLCSPSSLSSFPATLCMYIYKSAHNWYLGRSKEQRGREAIRGIKRGAASQPSFTGQWSKSNWVLFSGRTHTYVRTHTHTHTHIGDSVGATCCS